MSEAGGSALDRARARAVKVFLEKGGLGNLTQIEADFVNANADEVAAFCRMIRFGGWVLNTQAVTKVKMDIHFHWVACSVDHPDKQAPFLRKKVADGKLVFGDGVEIKHCLHGEVGRKGHVLFAPPDVSTEWMHDEFLLRGCRAASPFETIVTMFEVVVALTNCPFISLFNNGRLVVTRDHSLEEKKNLPRALRVKRLDSNNSVRRDGQSPSNVAYVCIEP